MIAAWGVLKAVQRKTNSPALRQKDKIGFLQLFCP
jgi:hypothetical protein